MAPAPKDRRILVWLTPQHTDYGEEDERGWFTAQWDGGLEFRVGINRIEGCSWVPETDILAWQELPPPPSDDRSVNSVVGMVVDAKHLEMLNLDPAHPLEGWHLCDGSEFSREEYPELFGVLGYTWGSGWPNMFKIPTAKAIRHSPAWIRVKP